MEKAFYILTAFIGGMGLGLLHFGGLWLTVRRLSESRRPGLLTLGSLVARTGVTVLGFYLLMGSRWERLAACLLGFIAMRTVLRRRFKPDQINLTAE